MGQRTHTVLELRTRWLTARPERHRVRPLTLTTVTLVSSVTLGSTWHWLPVGSYWHLMAESGPDVDSAPVVQDPQQSVIGAGLDRDQLHPHRLEAHTHEHLQSVYLHMYNV